VVLSNVLPKINRSGWILIYVAVALCCIHYFANPGKAGFVELRNWLVQGENGEFKRLAWWAAVNVLFYFLIPFLILRYRWHNTAKDFGIGAQNGGYQIYIYFFAFMLPLVFAVSFSPAFLNKYPYYQLNPGESLWPNFVIWELLYFFQFFALEFFFRGFMVQGLKAEFGINSILIMVVPYCMIHFSKPLPEAAGSIIAGLALGYLSYKKNSIIPGVFLHYSIALSMDLLALWQKGLLFSK
jgi:membrane protease YdiL (CAAX protease family)